MSQPVNRARRHGTILAVVGLALMLPACTDSAQSQADSACNGEEQPLGRLFLQQVGADSALIKWRGEANILCMGTVSDHLDTQLSAITQDGHRQALLSGLQPDTVYHYSVGGAAVAQAGHWFRTAPQPGAVPGDGNTHIWILGDSGTASEKHGLKFVHPGEAKAVKEGFLRYNREKAGDEPVDLLLLLGDNAYVEGSDAQWQGAFFDVYTDIIDSVATWPTIGNHEMGAAPFDMCRYAALPACSKAPVMMSAGGVSLSSDAASYDSDGNGPDPGGMPYLNIFTLPTAGEMGGVPSGTEQYYAFDYGNVHVVSLDSQLSNRDPAQRAAMRSWLVDDLSSNRLDWVVVVFHHPPYSKGQSHDSDIEQAEIDMRENFAPVFEEYGVDVVYSGHSHAYERSWYLHGHYASSDSFDAAQHAELNAKGEAALGQGDEVYAQISPSSGVDDRLVYTVAGSAGKADKKKTCPPGMQLGCTLPDWLAHPAHRSFAVGKPGYRSHGLALKGSVVLDAGRTTLTSRFVDEHGEVLDYFTITRE